jgi:quercetin dioxygenase-like cupin family protein
LVKDLPAAAAKPLVVGQRVTRKESAMSRRVGLVFAGGVIALVAGVVGTALPVPSNGDSLGLQVKFENDRVRVLELHLKPGEREAQHTHPQYVLYALSDYRVRNTNADGTTRVFERKAGDVYWGEPVTHGGENVGTTDVRAFIVELKAPSEH